MRRVRLLCLLPDLNGGGAERVMLYLLRGLDRDHFELTLGLGRLRGPYVPLIPQDVRVVEFGRDRAAQSVLDLASLFRSREFDVCFSMVSMNLAAVLARAVARSRVRLVLGARNHYSRSLPVEARNSKAKAALVQLLYPRADLVVCVSDGVREDLVRHFGLRDSHLAVIHNPVDVERIRALSADDPGHSWLAEATTIPVVISVGKLQPAKGYPHLLEAFKHVRAATRARLLILGQGPDRDAILDQLERDDLTESVQLLGFETNPYSFMSRSTILAHAALWEGFPNVLVEAMACGLPVVATNCPSGPAEIIGNNENGLLVPTAEPAALARGMLRLLGDASLRSRLADAGLRRVRGAFAIERIVERYAEVFATVADGPGRR